MHTLQLVKEFHQVFDHPVATEVNTPSAKLRLLRFRLLFEEVLEFGRAVGIAGLCEATQEEFETEVRATLAEFSVDSDAPVDLAEAADALGDIDYVCQGANLVFGFPAEEVVREIHRANMSKLDADGRPIYDAGGKAMKGPAYRAPDIKQLLIDYQTGELQARQDAKIFGPRS